MSEMGIMFINLKFLFIEVEGIFYVNVLVCRFDIIILEDLVEEVGCLYGYDYILVILFFGMMICGKLILV